MGFLGFDDNWEGLNQINKRAFICGYCGFKVSSNIGIRISNRNRGQTGGVFICTNCSGPTFFSPQDNQFPGRAFGQTVNNVPKEINDLYEEARTCTSQNCFTAAVMLCRKVLMNISVNLGAKENQKFIEYVNYLSENGYIPPNAKHWVDHIRVKGNEANHEIKIMENKDAKEILIFTEMMLKFIYEFPSMIPQPE